MQFYIFYHNHSLLIVCLGEACVDQKMFCVYSKTIVFCVVNKAFQNMCILNLVNIRYFEILFLLIYAIVNGFMPHNKKYNVKST